MLAVVVVDVVSDVVLETDVVELVLLVLSVDVVDAERESMVIIISSLKHSFFLFPLKKITIQFFFFLS